MQLMNNMLKLKFKVMEFIMMESKYQELFLTIKLSSLSLKEKLIIPLFKALSSTMMPFKVKK